MTQKKPWYVNLLADMRERIQTEMFCKTDKEEVLRSCNQIRRSEITEDERHAIVDSLNDISAGMPNVASLSAAKLYIESLRQDLSNGDE